MHTADRARLAVADANDEIAREIRVLNIVQRLVERAGVLQNVAKHKHPRLAIDDFGRGVGRPLCMCVGGWMGAGGCECVRAGGVRV